VSSLPPPRAVLFDVDGTLYRQSPVRACMAAELAAFAAGGSARRALRALNTLLAFRAVGEALRDLGVADSPLTRLQTSETARRIGTGPEDVERIVREWMFERPLKYLRLARRRQTSSLVAGLLARGVPIGVLSDYAPEAKLAALGFAGAFAPALCTSHPSINALKPHPRGFLRACEVWGLTPQEVLYVGDRADTDALGAAAAGMRCQIVSRERLLSADACAPSIAGAGLGALLRRGGAG
jgi:HAD superfamily hydrolase (TIGR01549 family)